MLRLVPSRPSCPRRQEHRPLRSYTPRGWHEFTSVVPGPQPSWAPGWKLGAREGLWG